ncbi:Primary-amine oxidase [Handroanthus impetiginosus]|uniref:Amine oxidase n=1 Tax=Handroanthus impetiginosus TaxID=429701 RepID=A0A2G9HHU4_9LAMI|nr:Primary-amine oxidase [Handroanthus impetiginosus]
MLSSLTNFLFFLLFLNFPILSTQNYHPLDPLTPLELIQVQAIVKNHFSHDVNFHYVGLDEPEKSTVLSLESNRYKLMDTPYRRAFVIARLNGKSHEIIVDLSSNMTVCDKVYNGNGFPLMNFGEVSAANKLASSYAPLIASIEKRGLKLEEVICMSFAIGWYGEEKSRRVVRVMCYYMDGTVNLYMRPIEGITVTVDLDQMKIIGYQDRVMVPVPKADGTDYRASKQSDSRRAVRDLDGPGLALDGHVLRWANWELHISFDMRAGLIISLASIYDPEKNEQRRVMYRGFISEVFVPYMDLTEEWYYRTFLDVGEYGFGLCAVPLVPLQDCPENAVFMDGYFTLQDGTPGRIPNVFCIFERSAGDVMWRHTELGIPRQMVCVTEWVFAVT